MGIQPEEGYNPLGRVEISFGAEGLDVVSPVSISKPVANLLKSAGWNPEEFNKVTWPIGAANHGLARFLIDGKTANAIAETLQENFITDEDTGWYRNDGITITFDGLLFDGMHMLAPVPVLSPSTYAEDVQFYVCDFVDYRYWWQKHTIGSPYFVPTGDGGTERKESQFQYGINMLEESMGPGVFHPETIFQSNDTSDILWNLPRLLNFMLGLYDTDELGFDGRTEFYYLPVVDAWRYDQNSDSSAFSTDDLIDISVSGRPFGEFLDSILTLTGHVLIAYPSEFWAGELSRRYWISPIENQQPLFDDEEFTEQFEHSIVSGGMLPTVVRGGTEVITDPTLDMAPASIAASVPEFINVFFRNAFYGGAPSEYIEENPEHNPALSDYQVVQSLDESLNLRPDIFWKGRLHSVYATLPAVKQYSNEETSWTNENACVNQANRIGRRFYDRFRCDPVNVILTGTFGNLNDLVLWPGAQEITWSITGRGPVTKIIGSYNHPLFGMMPDNNLSSGSVTSTATTKVVHRPDGRLNISSAPVDVRQTVYHAVITEVNQSSAAQRPYYSAEAVTDARVAVVNIAPRSVHDSDKVDIKPLQVGDFCMIGVLPNTDDEGIASRNVVVNPIAPGIRTLNGNGSTTVISQRSMVQPQQKYQNIDPVFNPNVPQEIISSAEKGIDITNGMFGQFTPGQIYKVGTGEDELSLVLYVWEYPLYSACTSEPGFRSAGFFGDYIATMGRY
jgi:hypothetical protein